MTGLANQIIGMPTVSFFGDFGGVAPRGLLRDALSTSRQFAGEIACWLAEKKQNSANGYRSWD